MVLAWLVPTQSIRVRVLTGVLDGLYSNWQRNGA